jgi:tetratricopeptide (TPR) repeat protein
MIRRTYFLLSALTGFLLCLSLTAQAPPQSSNAAELVKQGQALNNAGKQDEALALYRRAMDLSPDMFDAHLAAGMALDLKGEYGEARKHLNRAIELATAETKERALRAMAVSYAFEGKADESAKYEKQVFDRRLAKPDFPAAAEIANELARMYLESGDLNHASQWYKTGYDTALRKTDMSEADKNLWAFRWENAQARIAARRGQGDEAQKHVAAAKADLDKANNPDQARFFPYLTGYVAYYTGDYKTAVSDLQKADQRDPFILSLLAQAYEKTGDQAHALEYYRKVLAVNGHGPTNAFARPLAKKKITG